MISKDFYIDHIDIINHKIPYEDLNILKAEVYPYETDEAKTYIDDDRIIFACGIKLLRQGVGHCWVIPSIYVDKHKVSFVKEINHLLDTYSKKMKLHRIHTTIDEPFVNWIEKLGFKRESILKHMRSDKSDEYMYVKFFDN